MGSNASARPPKDRSHGLLGVPPLLVPLVNSYGYMTASGIHVSLELLQRLTRLRVSRTEDVSGARILCYWHRHVPAGFLYMMQDFKPYASLCHPAWQVRPWAVLGERLGWRIAYGSAGHGGRAAAAEVIAALRQGWSTFVCPDGPAGPAGELKNGVLYMSVESRRPIVPISFRYSRALTLPRWDQAGVPLPFSTVEAVVGQPIQVTSADLAACRERLIAALG
jgi:lysophospholipid acyltransferase (LPLAT)-like uncharacterized protein